MMDSDEEAQKAEWLAADPSRSPRDWKGKGFGEFSPFDPNHVAPGDKPWQAVNRSELRKAAPRTKARFLRRAERQAAARDGSLVWDERAREYRPRPGADGL